MPTRRRPAVLVPLRAPGDGKSRLAVGLSRDERAALAGAMLADVVRALTVADVGRVVLVADGPEASAAGSALALDVVRDAPGTSDLDSVLAAAAPRDDDVLVVMADLPCLTAADVAAVLEANTPVVVAPTADGGTGALLRRPHAAMPTAYGPDSARRHLAIAAARGHAATVVDREGTRTDVDTWDDLVALRGAPVGPATAAFLSGMGGRLRAAG